MTKKDEALYKEIDAATNTLLGMALLANDPKTLADASAKLAAALDKLIVRLERK